MTPRIPESRSSKPVEALERRFLLSSYVVTDTNDSGAGSLRADILMSNASPGANTITFAPGLSGAITLTTGQLEVAGNLAIAGPGTGSMAISGNNMSRVFQIDAGATVSISGLTISGGLAPAGATGTPATLSSMGGPGGAGGDGGGIYNLGMLTLSEDAISQNSAGLGGMGGPGKIVPGQTVPGGTGGSGGRGGGIYSAGPLTLADCTIDNNRAGRGGQGAAGDPNHPPGGEGGPGGDGGGIYCTGAVTITGSTIHANGAGWGGVSAYPSGSGNGGSGGGVFASGSLNVSISQVVGNFGGNGGVSNSDSGPGGNGGGGAGIDASGDAVITDSAISGNVAGTGGAGPAPQRLFGVGGSGGGILTSGRLVSVNCTIANNEAGNVAGTGAAPDVAKGGGIYAAGPTRLTNCTVSGNISFETIGGGLFAAAGVLLNNTIVALNGVGSIVENDVSGALDPGGAYNLIGDGAGMSGLSGANHNLIGTDQNPADAKLAPLGNYGGPTQTMAPLPGSPAIDAGSNVLALGPDGKPLLTDQRGLPRFIDATHTGTPTVDIGALEVGSFPASPYVVMTTGNSYDPEFDPPHLSLPTAVLLADFLGGTETISFAAGLSGTIAGNFELADTTGKVTIQGPGASVLSIGGLQIDAKVSAEIDGLGTESLSNGGTLTLNNVTASGAVSNSGTMVLADSATAAGISNNGMMTLVNDTVADAFTNGGTADLSEVKVHGSITNSNTSTLSMDQCTVDSTISSAGTLSLKGCTVTGQVANGGVATIASSSISNSGGSVIDNAGMLMLTASTVTGNGSDAVDNGGTATLTDCMVSGSHGVGVANATGGSLMISGGAVTGNTGGGVSGSATIGNCQITSNGGAGVSSAALALTNCTISGNKGDGIDVMGNLRADGCTIQNNTGRGVNDAAGSSVTLDDCTIVGNQSPTAGGGIYNPTGATLTLINSTISNNTATAGGGLVPQASGGGIENSGTALLANCTIAGNVASAGAATGAEISGGGIDNSGTLRLTNCTVASNSANAGASPTNDATGGGIYIAAGHVTLNNTIVAGNYTVPAVGGSPPDDIVGAVGPSSAYNLIGDASAATGLIAANHNKLGSADAPIDAKLGPLAKNGGPTQTMALLAGSPAIDAGSNALAVGPDGTPLISDQRGFGRIFNGTVDIGAYEFGASLLGDADRDGKVDFADLVLVARNYGKANAGWSDGDFNNDGSVGFDDLLIVARNYGKSTSVSGSTATFSAALVGMGSPISPTSAGLDVRQARHGRRLH